ncbi:uncharacterized protein Tco025E_07373, partial [Trypanosoma conorhini]
PRPLQHPAAGGEARFSSWSPRASLARGAEKEKPRKSHRPQHPIVPDKCLFRRGWRLPVCLLSVFRNVLPRCAKQRRRQDCLLTGGVVAEKAGEERGDTRAAAGAAHRGLPARDRTQPQGHNIGRGGRGSLRFSLPPSHSSLSVAVSRVLCPCLRKRGKYKFSGLFLVFR